QVERQAGERALLHARYFFGPVNGAFLQAATGDGPRDDLWIDSFVLADGELCDVGDRLSHADWLRPNAHCDAADFTLLRHELRHFHRSHILRNCLMADGADDLARD